MIRLIVKDSDGEELFNDLIEGEMNFLDECAENDVDLPFSCHAGACMSCSAKITKGAEHVDQSLDGEKYIETDEDVLLSCIAGPKKESLEDTEEHIVELEMLM